jgi:hypothetical protein
MAYEHWIAKARCSTCYENAPGAVDKSEQAAIEQAASAWNRRAGEEKR